MNTITTQIVDRVFGKAIVNISGELIILNVEVTKDEIGKEITFLTSLLDRPEE